MNSRSRSSTKSINRSNSSIRGRSRTASQSAPRTGRRCTSDRGTRTSRSNLRFTPSTLSRGRSLSQVSRSNQVALYDDENDPCVCGPDFYANVLGPTADETILVGLQTFMDFCRECPPSGDSDRDGVDQGGIGGSRTNRDSMVARRGSVADSRYRRRSSVGVESWREDAEGSDEANIGNRRRSSMFRKSWRDDTGGSNMENDREDMGGSSQRVASRDNIRNSVISSGFDVTLSPIPSDQRKVSIRSEASLGPTSAQYYGDEPYNNAEDDEVVEEDEEEDEVDEEEEMMAEEYWLSQSCQTARASMCTKMFQTSDDMPNPCEESQTENMGIHNQCQTIIIATPCSSSSSSSQTHRSCLKVSSKSNKSIRVKKSLSAQKGVSSRKNMADSAKSMRSCTCCQCIISDETSSSTPNSDGCSCSSCKMKAKESIICTCNKPAEGICSRSSSKKQVRVRCDCCTSTSSTGYYDTCNCEEDETEPPSQAGDTNEPKIRYAITKITKFYGYTTFEVMKSTRKKPRVMPKSLQGVFVLKNLAA